MAIEVRIDPPALITQADEAAKAVDRLTASQKKQAKAAQSAAKANARSLASFDTIERLKTQSASSGGGSSKANKETEETIEKTQGWVDWLERLLEKLRTMAAQVIAFFAGLGQQLFAGLQNAWAEYGAPIMEQLSQAFSGLGVLLQTLHDTILVPIGEAIIQGLTIFWQEHLLPLWENLTLFFGQLTLTVLEVWNSLLLPLLQWMAETFGPIIGQVGTFLVNTFFSALSALTDFANLGLIILRKFLEQVQIIAKTLGSVWQGVGETLKAVFQQVWEFVVGAINGIIGAVNALIQGVTAALNQMIRAINSLHIEIPDWSPIYGGERLGFNLSELPTPQIPYLATGAVIPANSPFLAVLGDQKQGVNIEAPLETMVEAFRAAQTGQNVTVRFAGNLAQLGRVLYPVLEKEGKRLGTSLAKGGSV